VNMDRTEYSFAPMEGFTTYIYRAIHERYFPGIDAYYTPFLSPSGNGCFTPKEMREIAPGPDSPGSSRLVPQLMTRTPEHFDWAVRDLAELGYPEVNLNLGCPSGTVCAKGKGAGQLRDPQLLDRFLDAVMPMLEREHMTLSVKTRLGWDDPEEFRDILPVFNRYPLTRVILHPRVRADQYREPVRLEAFEWALSESRAPLVYNGEIRTVADAQKITERFHVPIMIGRGLLANLALVREIRGGEKLKEDELRHFLAELYEAYTEAYGSANGALCRMKDLWAHAVTSFEDAPKAAKKLWKAKNRAEYESAVESFFEATRLKNS